MLDVNKGIQAGEIANGITSLQTTQTNVKWVISNNYPISKIVVTVDQGNQNFSTLEFGTELSVADSQTLLNDFIAIIQNQINTLTTQLQSIS